eukprot:2078298-Alexandrium_andersonii.AAC.1
MTEKRARFPGCSRGQTRELVSKDVGAVLSPLVKFICLKLAVLQKRYNIYVPKREQLASSSSTSSATLPRGTSSMPPTTP